MRKDIAGRLEIEPKRHYLELYADYSIKRGGLVCMRNVFVDREGEETYDSESPFPKLDKRMMADFLGLLEKAMQLALDFEKEEQDEMKRSSEKVAQEEKFTPFGKDAPVKQVTEEDAKILEREPAPLVTTVKNLRIRT